MPLFENGLKIATPILIGIGVLVLAPVVIPAIGTVVKPLAKATIKSGIILVEKGKELISGAAEALEDITAEIKAELLADREDKSANLQPDQAV